MRGPAVRLAPGRREWDHDLPILPAPGTRVLQGRYLVWLPAQAACHPQVRAGHGLGQAGL